MQRGAVFAQARLYPRHIVRQRQLRERRAAGERLTHHARDRAEPVHVPQLRAAGERAAADARDLGASRCSLEVRAGNVGAQELYSALGFRSLGVRPRYYSDGEDAVIMEGPLPLARHDVAGMELEIEEDNLDDIPDELIKGEEELSLEDLIQELEATTRTMDDNKEP